MTSLRALIAIASMCVFAGCSTSASRYERADNIALTGGLAPTTLPAAPFTLNAWFRQRAGSADWVVYIEGDGLAWKSRSLPSPDPTPIDPMGLKLAAADRAGNVLYLARPCQYGDQWKKPECTTQYWTSHRFSEEVVSSMNAAIDAFFGAQKPRLHLVGYSGGGAIAALLAARRADVESLRTVAGNLDTDFVNAYHKVSATPSSLNPITMAARLRNIAQIHYVGDHDQIIPGMVVDRYVVATGPSACIIVITVPGANHHSGWEEWSNISQNLPICR